MNHSLPQKLKSFIDDIEQLTDRDEKIDYLLETSNRFKEVPKEIAVRPFDKIHKVPACESDVHVWVSKNRDNTFNLYFAVDNPQGVSAKALAVILSESFSGTSKETIQALTEEIVNKIFGDSISLRKEEGMKGMIRLIKHFLD